VEPREYHTVPAPNDAGFFLLQKGVAVAPDND
jgi:hypothetical protein